MICSWVWFHSCSRKIRFCTCWSDSPTPLYFRWIFAWGSSIHCSGEIWWFSWVFLENSTLNILDPFFDSWFWFCFPFCNLQIIQSDLIALQHIPFKTRFHPRFFLWILWSEELWVDRIRICEFYWADRFVDFGFWEFTPYTSGRFFHFSDWFFQSSFGSKPCDSPQQK